MHDALEDVLSLQKFVGKDLSNVKYKNATFSICYLFNALTYQKEVHKNCPSLQILTEKKSVKYLFNDIRVLFTGVQ